MIKYFFVISFSFSITLYAQSPESLVVLEQFSQSGTKVKADIMMVNSHSEVFINGEKLSSSEVITQSPSIKAVSTFLTSKNENCNEGRFKHVIKRGKMYKSEEGCLYSKRFNQLSLSFKQLKKDSITK